MNLGLNIRGGYLLLALALTVPSSGQTLRSHKYSFSPGAGEQSVTATDKSITINYSVPEIEAQSFPADNGKWFRLGIPGHVPGSGIGKPELPVLSKLIVIPDGCTYKIKISEVKSARIKPSSKRIRGDLYPVQEGETKELQRKKPRFVIDKETYARRELIESDTVTIEPLGRSRGNNLATLSIMPARYNPRTKAVELITSMKIEVTFASTGAVAVKSPAAGNLLFGEQMAKGTLNFSPGDLITGYSEKPVRMIILTDTAFRKHLDPYIKWKTQKGLRVDVIYKGADYAGNNYADIKNAITKIYNSSSDDNPAPEYLLIVGSTAKIPYYGSGSVTDLYYGEFDGNGDYFPEMFIGRLPVADTTDLKRVVSKLIQYEKYEFADTNTYHRDAMATAGIDDSHATYMNGQVNYGVANYLTPSNNIKEHHYLYPNVKKDSVIKYINKGLSFINYTGHGSSSGWLYLNVTTSDVPGLTNVNMYPFIISNACQTSRFNTTSFGNALVLADKKGAIGYIGCSADSYWDEDYYWAVGVKPVALNPAYQSASLGALDRLFHTHGESPSEWYTSMGQIMYAGNLAVSGSTSSRKKYYWEIYNLVGDPSIIPYIGTPGTFSTSLPDTLPNNLKSYSFIADPFSYIAVSHFDTLWDASYVSPSGAVTLEMPGLTNDSCLIVITGQNKKPLIKTIYFSAISKPYLNLSGVSVNDSLGNSNGKADYNETVFLRTVISNLGSTSATGITADITCASPFVSITDGHASIGTLLPGAQKTLTNDLSFAFTGNIPDNSAVTFDLKIKYGTVEKNYKADLYVHSPDLEIVRYLIDDTETGNGNYLADPGETVKLIFSILNKGSSNASGVFSISSPDPELTLLDPSKSTGIMDFGSTTEIPMNAKISSATPSGTTVNLSAQVDCDPYIAAKSFSFRIGKFQETFESASLKIFPWINLSAKPWVVTQTDPYEGIIAAKSGAISDNQSTTLSMKVKYSGTDSLRFYYKVSSETNYDFLIFRINGTEMLRKSGETGWTRKAVEVPAGINTFEWIYKKDGSEARGADCAYIDLIDFSRSTPVTYIARDIMAAKLVSPVQKVKLEKEDVTVKLLNLGPDTIKGFNMAYKINDEMPVIQHFNDSIIYNGDTVTVTFSTKADLSYFGDYELVVFSFGNADDNHLNDTLKTAIRNKERRQFENERMEYEGPVRIGPNPFRDEFTITIESLRSDTVYVSLVSTTGKSIINHREMSLVAGENLLIIDGKMLEPAIYHLIIEGKRIRTTRKVVKLDGI